MTLIKSPPKRRCPSLDSGFFMDSLNIEDLPEVLLVEILCRVPCNKLIFQCKCVSKRWSDLISSTYFVGRYLRIQRDLQKPSHLTTLVWGPIESYSLLTSSDHPVFQSASFSLRFLPCYQPEAFAELAKSCQRNFLIHQGGCRIVPRPVIVATYKDLVLCCATENNHRDYYLCNPYTKQWTRLPPTRHVQDNKLPLALVCDPYYKCEGEEQFFINPEYRWKVVRVVPNTSDPHFHLEIFSSETHRWREFDVSCSRPFRSFDCYKESSSSIAYNGMLYWWYCDGSIFELDLSSCSGDHNNVAKCRFIELPADLIRTNFIRPYLIVSQGRLLMYTYLYVIESDDIHTLKAWELKQVVKEDNSGQVKFKWLVDRVSLTSKGFKLTRTPYRCHEFRVEAFHQNNEDILYLLSSDQLITCHLNEGRLEAAATQIGFRRPIRNFSYPFVLPWWPTPILASRP